MREGWVQTTLGEVAVINPRPTKKRAADHSFKYVDIGSVRYGTELSRESLETYTPTTAPSRAKREILSRDVVLSTVRPNLRGMAIVPDSLNGEVASTGFAVLRAKPDLCTPGFVWAVVSSDGLSESLTRVATGSNYPAVSATDVANQRVALPPLHEQRRIVDLMDSVDAAISAAQAEVDAGVGLRNRMLEHELGNPADDWEQTTLGEIADWYSGATPKVTNRSFYEGGNIPWAKIGDVNNGEITETEVMITAPGLREIGRTAPAGSVLVTMYGSIGRSALVKREMATNQAITWGVPKNSVSSEFLFLLTKSSEKRFDALGRGATQRNINRKIVKDLAIDLPPQVEQQRIVAKMAALDSAVTAAETALDRLREVRSSMLTVLLSGEHEIPETYDQFLTEAAAGKTE